MILLGVEPSLVNFTAARSFGTCLFLLIFNVSKNRAEKSPYNNYARWRLPNRPTLTGLPLCMAFWLQNRNRKLFEKVRQVVLVTIAMTVQRNHSAGLIILPKKQALNAWFEAFPIAECAPLKSRCRLWFEGIAGWLVTSFCSESCRPSQPSILLVRLFHRDSCQEQKSVFLHF